MRGFPLNIGKVVSLRGMSDPRSHEGDPDQDNQHTVRFERPEPAEGERARGDVPRANADDADSDDEATFDSQATQVFKPDADDQDTGGRAPGSAGAARRPSADRTSGDERDDPTSRTDPPSGDQTPAYGGHGQQYPQGQYPAAGYSQGQYPQGQYPHGQLPQYPPPGQYEQGQYGQGQYQQGQYGAYPQQYPQGYPQPGYPAYYPYPVYQQPVQRQSPGIAGLVFAAIGAILLIVAFTTLHWYSAGGAHQDFSDLHKAAKAANQALPKAYFSWLAWIALIVCALVAVLACMPLGGSVNVLRALALLLGLGGIAITLFALKGSAHWSPFFKALRRDGDIGIWLTFAGFLILGIGGLIGPRKS